METKHVAKWWVCFYDDTFSEPVRFWDKWLHPRYRHCMALGWSKGVWILINPRWSGTDVIVLDAGPSKYPTFNAKPTAIVPMEACPDKGPPRCGIIGPVSCVETIKGLVGCKDYRVLTPRQLARWGEKQNARRELSRVRSVDSDSDSDQNIRLDEADDPQVPEVGDERAS